MNSRRIFFLMVVILLFAATAFCAPGSWQTWKEGTVTKATWSEEQQLKIEVDGIPYSFMPGAKTYKVTRQRNGGFSQDPSNTNRIFRSQQVNMLIQGFRIYQLEVMQ